MSAFNIWCILTIGIAFYSAQSQIAPVAPLLLNTDESLSGNSILKRVSCNCNFGKGLIRHFNEWREKNCYTFPASRPSKQGVERNWSQSLCRLFFFSTWEWISNFSSIL